MRRKDKMQVPVTKPFFDEREIQLVKETLGSGWVAQGLRTYEFEKKVAEHENAKYAVATSNCTTALHLALLINGIGKEHDVIVPSFTFVATANAVTYTGATPVFADIDLTTFNISVSSIKKIINEQYTWSREGLVNKKSNNRLAAIMPVHQFGLCADMTQINAIAYKYNLKVIEDAACALGAQLNGVNQGGFGNVSCVSFHPRKCITTGEGGMVFTNNEEQYVKLKELRSQGAKVSEVARISDNKGYLLPEYLERGYNYRLSDLQSAVGLAQIEKLDYILEKRRNLAKRYNELLKDCEWIKCPVEPEGYYHTYQSYVCLLRINKEFTISSNKLRNKIMDQLTQNGVQTRQGTHAVHTLGYYRTNYKYESIECLNAYIADQLSFTLPLYPQQTELEQDYVIEQLIKAYEGQQ